jgi:hypothetical protein
MRNGSFLVALLLTMQPALWGQRSYTANSVLASGNWYRISVTKAGVYKIDASFLQKLGISTNQLSSSSIRLFGNGGGMLPEACNGFKNDDLQENAIQVIDGGDGIFNGDDYFIFYAEGPHTWLKDSINQRFKHQQNLYSNQAFYFITVGGTGKRIQTQASGLVPNTVANSFSGRYFHELDSINFLSSGKDWYGEELSVLPGHTASKTFSISLPDINSSQPAIFVSKVVARTIGASSGFSVSNNGQPILQQQVDGVGSTNLDLFAKSTTQAASFAAATSLSINYNFTPGVSGAEGWIDWFELFWRQNLILDNNSQLLFRDWNSVGSGNIVSFSIRNAANAQVWDIGNTAAATKMITTANGSELSFVNDAGSLHEYVVFSGGLLVPTAIGKINNQNIHHSDPVDLIIVTYPLFLPEAQKIALFHQRQDNFKTAIASTEQIFNEFSSGTPDPAAIRDFVKMYYDKAGADSSKRPRYLMLLGDASFDYKNRLPNNTSYVPAYENSFSLDPLSTYTSDDFFGFLDDNEDIGSGTVANFLDIGIGRIPVQTTAQARAYIDKLVAYTNPESLGPWRNHQTFVADDQDQNLHLNDAEAITSAAAAINPLFVQNKIYLDAYTQTSTPAGSRYPEVNQAIKEQIENGTLIWNYNGHGSYSRLAEEVVLEKEMVDSWNNPDRLPLFITATCDFAPYDNPAINSLGENILLREKTGAIALMTTTRLVFAFSNRIINRNYLQAALQPRQDGTYPSLGDAVKQAKNFTYQTQSDITNNRKFTLLGDPALTLAYPRYRVVTDSINSKAVNIIPDTLKALQKYIIKGRITDAKGFVQTGFNGTLYATMLDKAQTVSTRANDADSYQQSFKIQSNQLFKGKVTVTNGAFELGLIVPKDINYQLGNGSISYYADNGLSDGNGNFTGFLIGGSQGISNDITGPGIKAFLNNENFVNGMQVEPAPLLLVQLADSSGINIAGEAIGHDITAVIDGDARQTFVLNSFFETALDNYGQGSVRFQLPELAEGIHTIIIKAWDVANNSSETVIRFTVKRNVFRILSLFNYPNPVDGPTIFRFEHNRPDPNLGWTIKIYTPFGKLVKTMTGTINSSGTRSSEVGWDGTADHETVLSRGLYIYQLELATAGGEKAVKAGKLIRQ